MRLRLTTTGLHGKTCRVWLNDEEVSGRVQRVVLTADCQDANRAVLTLLVDEVEIDGQALIVAKKRSWWPWSKS